MHMGNASTDGLVCPMGFNGVRLVGFKSVIVKHRFRNVLGELSVLLTLGT